MFDQYQGLIFDMDGTLVDSGQLHEKAWAYTLETFGLPLDRPYMRSLAGVPTKKTVELIIEKFALVTTFDLDVINDAKETWVRQNLRDYVKPTSLIEVVKQYHGTRPMAVGTGAYTDEAREILEHCGLLQYMDAVVGADQVATPKPAPDTFLRCAALIGVTPSHCVVFEDAPLGLEAATRAGMVGVDVLTILNIENDYFL